MKHLLGLTTLTIVLASAPTAQAQYFPNQQIRPTNTYARPPILSPYLNLIPVRPAGVNYFLNVRPELDRRAVFGQINSQLMDLERQRLPSQTPVEDPLLPPIQSTGHPVGFMNFAPYFNFTQGNAGGGAPQTFRPPPSRGARGGGT